jgi:preprotein translocase subunit YajC
MKKSLLFCFVISLGLIAAVAQDQEQGPRRMFGGPGVVGKVTAIGNGSVTVAPANGGAAVTVKVSDSTKIFKERQPVKLSDIKVDDTVMVRGQLNGNNIDAAMMAVVNPEMLQRMQQGGMQFNREDLGKKFIAGQVKAINETKLTITRPDNQDQEIEVDENTSFKRGQESITLADIKVGDFVRGQGALKDGIFVPKELIVGRPRMFMRQEGDGEGQPKPNSDKPVTAPKN